MSWSPLLGRGLFAIATVTLCLLFGTAQSNAQVFGVWSNPAPTPKGSMQVSGHFMAGDLTGIMGNARFGVNDKSDVGIQLGIPDFDGGFGIAGDYRYQIVPASATFPIDLSAYGAFGYLDGPSETVQGRDFGASFQFYDFGAIASKAITTAGGQTFSPYGAFALSITKASIDEIQVAGQSFGGSATDTEFGIRGGVWFELPQGIGLNGELNIGSGDRFYVSFGAGIPL